MALADEGGAGRLEVAVQNAEQFEPPFPARTTVAVAALPLGAAIEVELIARA